MIEPRKKDKRQIGGVYVIRNKNNGRVYIGASKYIKGRWSAHRTHLRENRHHAKDMQTDYDNDKACLDFSLLEECAEEILIDRERHWIDQYGGLDSERNYNSAYNSSFIADIKKRMKGNKNGEGVVFTEERKRKIGEASGRSRTGKKLSEEHRKNKSDAAKKWWADRRRSQL